MQTVPSQLPGRYHPFLDLCLCKNNCGRVVSTGLTGAGKSFDTCCKSCALGIGHDAICGERLNRLEQGLQHHIGRIPGKEGYDQHFAPPVDTSDFPTQDVDPRLSYVAQAAHRALRVGHSDQRKTSWSVTSGRIVGELLQTPPKEYFTDRQINSDVELTHSDSFPKKMAEVIRRAKRWVDITSLAPPDGKFATEITQAIAELSGSAAADGVTVRVLFGNIIGMPCSVDSILATLTKGVEKGSKIKVWVGAWRKDLSWNHSKIIAVDGKYLITGGHNMWDDHYLKKNPVRDLSLELEGPVSIDGHLFANEMWRYIERKDIEQREHPLQAHLSRAHWLPLIKRSRVSLSCFPRGAERYPPMYPPSGTLCAVPIDMTVAEDKAKGNAVMLTCGRFGSMNHANPSDSAIAAMIASARRSIKMSLQDLGPLALPGPTPIPGGKWPEAYLRELGKAISQRGVDVHIVLSAPHSVPSNLSCLVANYGNGWSCNDVAAEIVKVVKNSQLVFELKWSQFWVEALKDRINKFRAKSADASTTHLYVRDCNAVVMDILEGGGQVIAEKCKRVSQAQFPLKVCGVFTQARLRQLISDNLRVTYMRSTLGPSDWAHSGIAANHAKFFIVDDQCFYIGSQNLYIADLAEWGVIVDDEAETTKVLESYWNPLWARSYNTKDCTVEDVLSKVEGDRDGTGEKDFSTDELRRADALRRAANHGTLLTSTLVVTVQRAENLINKDGFGSGLSDPYVKVHIRDKIGNIVGGGYKNTSVIQDNLNPEWNEMLVFEGITDPQTCTLYLEVFDEDYVLFFSSLAKHDELGKASVDLGTLANVDCFQDLKLQLTGEPFANSRLYIGLNTLGEWGKEEWGGL